MFTFGLGLSYTTFKYSMGNKEPMGVNLDQLRNVLAKNNASPKPRIPSLTELSEAFVSYSVNVSNTGTRDADNVVLGFLVPPGSGSDGVPLKILFGFERVFVAAGKTVSVFLYPQLQHFMHVDTHGKHVALAGQYRVEFGIPSGDHEFVSQELFVR